jgi:plasmid stabilization system protein ParE
MQFYRVNLTNDADNDLEDIRRYLSRQCLLRKTAQRFVRSIRATIERNLSFMAEGYRLVNNDILAAKGLRRLVVKKYLVFFTVNEETKTVTVARVIHGRRDWAGILQGVGDDKAREQ